MGMQMVVLILCHSLVPCCSLTGDKQCVSPPTQPESYELHPLKYVELKNDPPELCDSAVTRYKAKRKKTSCSLNWKSSHTAASGQCFFDFCHSVFLSETGIKNVYRVDRNNLFPFFFCWFSSDFVDFRQGTNKESYFIFKKQPAAHQPCLKKKT